MENNTLLYEQLKEDIERGRVIAFVGAGVSMLATGNKNTANWKGLLLDGVKFCLEYIEPSRRNNWEKTIVEFIQSGDDIDFITAAHQIETRLRSYDKFHGWLAKSVGSLTAQCPEIIRAIIELDIPIITTNYDNLFLDEGRQYYARYDVATWKDKHKIDGFMNYREGDANKYIFHLHGYWDEPNSVIFGVSSYSDIQHDEYIQTILRSLPIDRTLLFIGFGAGISDPNFKPLRLWYARNVMANTSRAIIRLSNTQEMSSMLSEHSTDGIRVLEYGSEYTDLTDFIQKLKPSRQETGIERKNRRGSIKYRNSLGKYVGEIGKYTNSWERLFKEVEFIGRDAELPPTVVYWQVLYGDNAVGKSRLAYEWLKELTLKGWETGFIEYSLATLTRLLEFDPLKSTAIVIDEVNVVSNDLWNFLDAADTKWNTLGIDVRILLISHSNIKPVTGKFAISERVKKIRSKVTNMNKDELPVSGNFSKDNEFGIVVRVLKNEEDQKKIIQLASGQIGKAVTEKQVEEFIKLANGRPAFLTLAGSYPGTWRIELRSYAEEIIEKANNFFPEDGKNLLLLSALACPVTDEVRERIAPHCNDIKLLSEIFAQPARVVAEILPPIEPDMLANEIIFAILENKLTKSQKSAIIDAIVRAAPDRVLERVTNIWNEASKQDSKKELQNALINMQSGLSLNDFELRMSNLELLFLAVAKAFPYKILNSPYSALTRVRASFYAETLLCDDLAIELLNNIIKHSLEEMPEDGMTDYIAVLQKSAQCTPDNRLYWALLIDSLLGEGTLFNSISENNTGKWNLPCYFKNEREKRDLIFERVKPDLNSNDACIRFYSLSKIQFWGQMVEVEPNKIIGDEIYESLLDLLCSTIMRHEEIDILGVCWTWRWLLLGNNVSYNANRIRKKERDILLTLTDDFEISSLVFEALAVTIGIAFGKNYDLNVMLTWFSKSEDSSEDGFYIHDAPANIVKLFHRALDAFPPDSKKAIVIADVLFRLDEWSGKIEDIISHKIFKETDKKQMLNYIIRLSYLNNGAGASLLKKILLYERNDFSEDFRLVSLAGLLLIGASDILRSDQIKNRIIADISINALVFDLDGFKEDKTFTGDTIKVLQNKLNDIYIGCRGHLIHKIKAKDTTGKWAYYFVLVLPTLEKEFLAALEGEGTIDLENYGKIIDSCYGEVPDVYIKKRLFEKYGFIL